ncbi:hypothetical protein BH688_07605 [Kushneria phosphatilytica]|nr:hypothetical protein BH688_07605 [Kushneria phosphatilytica]
MIILVKYLCPLLGIPEFEKLSMPQSSPSCFAVYLHESAGIKGPIIEGDILVVNESLTPGHGDLVVAEVEGFQQLYRLWRPSARWRLLPG